MKVDSKVASQTNSSTPQDRRNVKQVSELPIKKSEDSRVELSLEAREKLKSEELKSEAVKESSSVSAPRKSRTLNKPAIIFIKDGSINPFTTSSLGLDSMASNIPHSEVYSWSEEDAIYESIQRRPHTQPVILVGHGLGADTAVEVSNRLNKVESSFRKVNLLVTLNSQGFDNDVIPQNVSANLNFISEKGWFDDGPNIARNTHVTQVANQIRSEAHDDLDESSEVQFAIFEEINKTLNDAVAHKMRNWSQAKEKIDKFRSQ